MGVLFQHSMAFQKGEEMLEGELISDLPQGEYSQSSASEIELRKTARQSEVYLCLVAWQSGLVLCLRKNRVPDC